MLDNHTATLSALICLGLATLMMGALWYQQSQLRTALRWWFFGMLANFLAFLVLAVRGSIENITLSWFGHLLMTFIPNLTLIIGTLLIYVGLSEFVGVAVKRRAALGVLVITVVSYAWNVLIIPSQVGMAAAVAVAVVLVSLLCLQVLRDPAARPLRPASYIVMGSIGLLILIALLRLVVIFLEKAAGASLHNGVLPVLLLLMYPLVLLFTSIGLMLLLTQRQSQQIRGDLQALEEAYQALAESEGRLARAELVAKFGNWELDLSTRTIIGSAGAKKIYGITGSMSLDEARRLQLPEYHAALDSRTEKLVTANVPYDVQYQIRTADTGELKDIHSVAIYDAVQKKIFGIVVDITLMKNQQRELERQAHFDVLTGLPRRNLLTDRLAQAIALSQRQGTRLAIAFIDLDGFKAVNDQHGHEAGDAVLVAVSERMKASLRSADTLARFGGDEFVVLLTDVPSDADCEQSLVRLIQAAAEPVHHGDQLLAVSASIGYTCFPDDNSDVGGLLSHADMAMYAAKQAGKNGYCRYANIP